MVHKSQSNRFGILLNLEFGSIDNLIKDPLEVQIFN